MIPLYFLKSRGQFGGRDILGRSSNGSLGKGFFGSLRDFTACFSLSISVLTYESMIVGGSFEWIGLNWGACKDWTILAKDVTCAVNVLIMSSWWAWIRFIRIYDGSDREFDLTNALDNCGDFGGNDRNLSDNRIWVKFIRSTSVYSW